MNTLSTVPVALLALLAGFAAPLHAEDDPDEDAAAAPLRHHPDYGTASEDAFRAPDDAYDIRRPADDPGLDTPEPLLDDSPPDHIAAPARQQTRIHPHVGKTQQHPRSDANQVRGIELPSDASQ